MFACTFPGCTAAFETAQQRGVHRFSAHDRQHKVKAIEHGTKGGYLAHRRRDQQPCSECRSAWREYYEKKRSSSNR